MFVRLLLVFTIVPAVELYLLITIGQWIGPLATVGVIVLTGMLGAAFAKREGLAVIAQLREGAAKGIPPATSLVEGLMVLVGGALLLTPGVMTDVLGFTLILPWTRPVIARAIGDRVKTRFTIGGAEVRTEAPRPGPAVRPQPQSSGFDHPVK